MSKGDGVILGITGKNSSGKDTVAEMLKKKGFLHISLSDMIRTEAKKRSVIDTRENLIALGNELRRQYGSGVLAQWAVDQMKDGKEYVITSFRNPGEVDVLQSRQNFLLICVQASPETRWRYMQQRAFRQDNLKTYEEFLRREAEEAYSVDPVHQQVNAVMALADVVVYNDETLDELRTKVDKITTR